MLSEVNCNSYMKREAGTGVGGIKDCHKPDIRQKTEKELAT